MSAKTGGTTRHLIKPLTIPALFSGDPNAFFDGQIFILNEYLANQEVTASELMTRLSGPWTLRLVTKYLFAVLDHCNEYIDIFELYSMARLAGYDIEMIRNLIISENSQYRDIVNEINLNFFDGIYIASFQKFLLKEDYLDKFYNALAMVIPEIKRYAIKRIIAQIHVSKFGLADGVDNDGKCAIIHLFLISPAYPTNNQVYEMLIRHNILFSEFKEYRLKIINAMMKSRQQLVQEKKALNCIRTRRVRWKF